MTTTTPTAQRFRERPRPPATIEAMQITGPETFVDVWRWTRGAGASVALGRSLMTDKPVFLRVIWDVDDDEAPTASTDARLGDWVLRHEDGRLAVMSPDEFARRYEPLPEAATAPPVGETLATNQP